ncbi:hypothetical protein D2962_13390 [Biomaibacter acetigenes]|uniref:Uncharacterized protein n=1 Tax=Biomaibacter acetigenes TaxID=2316383 RepID=A0A3G2R7P4_9FIRM|nr:hypothetical protein D2962_13390 [Biomaibacter acetigenes]
MKAPFFIFIIFLFSSYHTLCQAAIVAVKFMILMDLSRMGSFFLWQICPPVPGGVFFGFIRAGWMFFYARSGRPGLFLFAVGCRISVIRLFCFFPGPSYNQIVIRTAPEKQVAGRRDEGRLFRWNNGGRHAFFPQRCGGVQKGLAKIR